MAIAMPGREAKLVGFDLRRGGSFRYPMAAYNLVRLPKLLKAPA
jgi:hypothetical protein